MKPFPYQGKIEPVSQDAEASHPDAWVRLPEYPVRFLVARPRVPPFLWEGVLEPSLFVQHTDFSVALDTGSDGTNHGRLINFSDPEASRSSDRPSVLNGRSLRFTAANLEYVSLTNTLPSAPATGTYATWLRLLTAGVAGTIFGPAYPSTWLTFIDNQMYFGNAGAVATWGWIQTTLWTHLAVTVSGAGGETAELFVNGVSQGTRALTGGAYPFALFGGGDSTESTRYLDGWLDDVRYYDAALNSTQVGELVVGGEATGAVPVHHWTFDEVQAPTPFDAWFREPVKPVLPLRRTAHTWFAPSTEPIPNPPTLDMWFKELELPALPKSRVAYTGYSTVHNVEILIPPPMDSWFKELELPVLPKPRVSHSLWESFYYFGTGPRILCFQDESLTYLKMTDDSLLIC